MGIGAAALALCLSFVLRKKKNWKNYAFVLLSAAALVYAVFSLDVQGKDDYYSAAGKSGNMPTTITIRCDTIFDNADALEAAKAPYVPEDGEILPVTTVEFTPGETVFQVLQRVCEASELQLEYSWTPLYDSYYVEGINHLYEFDCGFESGWMYKVDGWFPNYGCSAYELQGGEEIVWYYTCKGLGTDVGAERME
jgi:hypothetical protein